MSDDYIIRDLERSDLLELAKVMAEGFPLHPLEFWQDRLAGLVARERAPGTPLLGYGIEAQGLQGAALAIGSRHGSEREPQTIVNISSWTVRPSMRGPAAKQLYAHASAPAGATYSNLSAAAHTIRTITNFGFTESTAGQFIAVGLQNARPGKANVLAFADIDHAGLPPELVGLMQDHAIHGCIAVVIETTDRLVPLIFLPRRVKPGIPIAQLIYCERMSDVQDHARRIYRSLLGKGFVALLLDASGPIDGLLGRYIPGRAAKYYKGPKPQAAIDHTYSEMIYIGF